MAKVLKSIRYICLIDFTLKMYTNRCNNFLGVVIESFDASPLTRARIYRFKMRNGGFRESGIFNLFRVLFALLARSAGG